MLNKKILIGLIIVVGIFVQVCYAKHSDEYPIGVYSHIVDVSDYTNCITKIDSGNFNYFRFSTNLNDHFGDADSRGLDVWFDDHVWYPYNDTIPDRMSPYLPSFANNFTYEVEQENENSPPDEACPDHYHYIFTRDENCGRIVLLGGEEYAWKCVELEHDAGYAVKDIYYKWANYQGENQRLDYQISFNGKIKDLYVIFKMKLENDPTIAPTEPICEISVVCDTSGNNDYYSYEIVSTDTAYDTILLKEDFDEDELFTLFEYKISIKDEPLGNYLIPSECRGSNYFKNFNPRVYWYNKGNLWIDNVTVEDDIYKKLKNGDYDSSLVAELSLFTGIDNLISFNSVDEPMAPQFNSYKHIEDVMEYTFGEDGPGLLTAVSCFSWQHTTNYNYHHVNLFDYLAEPKYISTDIYQCYEAKKWNAPPSDGAHIQKAINTLAQYYRTLRTRMDKSFIGIIQSFGYYYDAGYWKGCMLPPSETLKALAFIPLCYDACGISYFHLRTTHHTKDEDIDLKMPLAGTIVSSDEPYDLVGLLDEDDNPMSQFYAVQEANAKIAVYGPIIDSLRWLGANHDNEVVNEGTVYETGLTSVEVLEDTSSYNGYIEIGAYKDDDTGNSYFMLVNRRANFIKDEYDNYDPYSIPHHTPPIPLNVDTAYVSADPQDVTFYFSDLEVWREYAFIDMYTEETIIGQVPENGKLEANITIGPGDGKLIQMAIHPPIPYIVESSFVVPANKHCIIDYPITVEEGGMLILSEGVTLHFWENGFIEVYGDIEIGDNVKFTAPEEESCDGLYLYNTDAEVIMNNVTFERCKLHNESLFLNITNSDFTNSGIEQSGDVLELYYTNFDNSRVSCFWESGKSPIPPPAYIEVDVNNCYFENYNGYAVEITNYPLYEFHNNTITNCGGGFLIWESGNPKKCIISDNHIYDNSGDGIFIYHSYANICDDNEINWGQNVITNNLHGILGRNNSSITIIGNPDYPHSTIQDNEAQELYFDPSSFPEKICYNKIIDDNYINGSVDQYLIFCRNYTGGERELIVEDNYWGPESEDWIEWTGDSRFLPDNAYDYIPVWIPGPPVNPPKGTGAKGLYADADSLILEEDYEQAKSLYKDIIEQYPESKYAIFSMRNLLPLETVSGQDFASLQEYYQTDPNCNYDDERSKLSSYLANYCNIKLENYPDAITFFEDIISDPDTELDSVYAVIDAGYTYLLMGDGGGKSTYVGRIAELKPKSVVEFEETRDKLLAKVLGLPEQDGEESIPENIFYLGQNYPNPMQGSTTISFSIPKDAKNSDIKIYNIKGQLVKQYSIINSKSSIEWDGKNENNKPVSNGIYFYRLETDREKSKVKKILFIR